MHMQSLDFGAGWRMTTRVVASVQAGCCVFLIEGHSISTMHFEPPPPSPRHPPFSVMGVTAPGGLAMFDSVLSVAKTSGAAQGPP